MRVQCPQCTASGSISNTKIPAAGMKIVCPKCKTSFFVKKEEQVEEKTPRKDATAYYKEGVQLLKGRQIDAAIEKFNAAIQMNPQYGDVYKYLGLAYGQKKLWREASQVLQKALTHKPDDVLLLKNLGVAYLRQKRFTDAEQVLQEALRYAREDEKIQSYLAMAVRGSKKSASGRIPPKDQEAALIQRSPIQELLDKGIELLDNAQHNKAIEIFQEAIRLRPNSSDGYFGLGMVHEKRQDWPKAIEAYQKAVELSPNDSLAKENLRFAKKQNKKFRFTFWKK